MFIQVMQGEIKDLEGARETMNRWREELEAGAEGWIGGTFGVSDDGQLVAVVRFESEEAARRNSERPEQGAWWSDMSAHFIGDVAFHDYSEVVTLLDGGSDDAGFVQIIQGRIANPARFREMADVARRHASGLRAPTSSARRSAWRRTVSSPRPWPSPRSRPPARARCSAMPDEAREFMAELQDLTFIDLKDPWFESA